MRLGVLGEWENPYMTLKPEFEAKQIEIFGNMAQKGYIYKGLKPVYWCPDCNTALAEAEIEYEEDPCFSIYVKFAVKGRPGQASKLGIDVSKPTLSSGPPQPGPCQATWPSAWARSMKYCAVKANGEYYIMARSLLLPR